MVATATYDLQQFTDSIGKMNIQSHKIELYGQIIDLPAPKVFANLVHSKFNPIEEKWHNRISDDFYKVFENLDDVYENSDRLAQDVLSESVNVALGILAENSIYDVDDNGFLEKYLSQYEVWDEHFELVASQYEAIVQETAQKDAYRTQRRLNRNKLVGFGPVPSIENGYRSAQSYANFSNAVDNVGHGIFNLMAKGVTAIGNSIKKDEIFKSQKTVQAIDAAVCSIILASKAAVIDALNERCGGAIHNYTKDEITRASAILANVENGRIPESDIQKEILDLFVVYPYDERIYKHLLTKFGADGGNLDKVADFFGISILKEEKEKIFRARLNDTNLSSVAAIQSNAKLFSEFAKNIGYSGYEKDIKELLDVARENEFQQEVAKYPIRTLSECDQNLAILEKFAQQIGYSYFSDWATNLRGRIEAEQKQEELKQQQKQKEDEEFAKQSRFMQFMTSKDPSVQKKRGAISLGLILIIYLLYKWNPSSPEKTVAVAETSKVEATADQKPTQVMEPKADTVPAQPVQEPVPQNAQQTQQSSAEQSNKEPQKASELPAASKSVQVLIAQIINGQKAGNDSQINAGLNDIKQMPVPRRGDRKVARQLNDEGLALLKTESYQPAIQKFSEAVAADPADQEVQNNLGYAYLLAGNYAAAGKSLEAAIALDPMRSSAWFNLATLFAKAGNEQNAVATGIIAYRMSKNQQKTLDFLTKQAQTDNDPKIRAFATKLLSIIQK